MTNEIWKPVVGYENFYEVSNTGCVRSKKRNGTNGIILSPTTDKDGYKIVGIKTPTEYKKKKIHRLVAQAFITNIQNKSQINHIDNNRSNNNVSNLEWCTSKENTHHAKIQGRLKGNKNRCTICGKFKIKNAGTCSKKCEQIQATRPKFPEHGEEDFLQRFQLGVSHERHASPSGQDDQASPVPNPAGADVASGGDD